MARPQQTLADFAAIAIGPVLIMFLVGSLCFFLTEVAFNGQASTAFRWVLGWFVIGIVLIARLSIEQGSAQATAYGAMLAAATAFVLGNPVSWLLLAVAWWCAHKLTWDCTVIDDRVDASGEGLLDAAGVPLDHPPDERTAAPPPDAPPEKPRTRPKSKLEEFVDWMNSEDKRPHAPGVWVLYFSLAALPLFGLGELFIPRESGAVRTAAFQDLFIYTASALALLVTTSFLGLRRYLRQRKVEMPTEIAVTWIGGGAAVVIAVLVVCLVIPRPYSETSITAWLERQSEAPKKEASDYAVVDGDAGEGTGRAIGQGEKPADQQTDSGGSSNNQANSDQGATSRQNDGRSGSGDSSNDQNGGSRSSDSSNNSGSSSGNQSNSSGQSQSSQNSSSQNSSSQNSSSQNSSQNDSSKGQNPPSGSNSSDQQKPPDGIAKKFSGGERSDDSSSSNGDQRGDQNDGKSNDGDSSDSSKSSNDTQNGRQPPPPQHSATPKASPPSASDMFREIARLFALVTKWLIYFAIAAAVVYALWNYGSEILNQIGKLWSDLLAWWSGATGAKKKAKTKDDAGPLVVGPAFAPFGSFRDPFRTGEAARLATPQLLAYTFEAAQAWARERGLNDRSDLTPLEFAQEAARRFPDAAGELPLVAQTYAAMLYGSRNPPDAVRATLERLWLRMSTRRPAGVA